MSGGSYEYICFANELDDLIIKKDQIESMADTLAGLGYAEDAARETHNLLLTLRQAETRIMAMHSRLEDVWRAVEWWESCDSGEDAVHKALAEYRGES